jgi:hypothetical protein
MWHDAAPGPCRPLAYLTSPTALRFYSNPMSGSALTWSRAMRIGGIAVLAGIGLLAGCTNASLRTGQDEVAAGDYAAAHQHFSEAARAQLSPDERREALDGLCRTEYQIGAPTYPVARQLRTCTEAVNEPGSESGPIFAAVARKQRASVAATINAAIAQADVSRADEAILQYRTLPGADNTAVVQWTSQLWTVINQTERVRSRKAAIAPAISEVSRQFQHVRSMNQQRFRKWVEQNMTLAGNPIVSQVEIGKTMVQLWIGDDQRANAALNLDRFVRINDGLIARCRCDGRTKVELAGSGLPAYLVRLDPETRQSEVLILDQ